MKLKKDSFEYDIINVNMFIDHLKEVAVCRFFLENLLFTIRTVAGCPVILSITI